MPARLRTFVAVEIDAETRNQVAALAQSLADCDAKVKWVAAHNLHLTLKFLGDVEVNETVEICQAVTQAAASHRPFQFHVCGVGAFPNLARPRTLWLGAGDGQEEVVALQQDIDQRLARLGYPKEKRRFRPHLTIGRVRQLPPGGGNLGELIAEQEDFDAGASRIDEVVVFSSELESTGPTYTALGRGKLRG